jgi:hypothetical protein
LKIKGIKPQGKPRTENERFNTPPQAGGVLKTIINHLLSVDYLASKRVSVGKT